MDFFARKISNSVPKCSVHLSISRSTSTSYKTHSLNDLAPVNSNDRALTVESRLLSSKTFFEGAVYMFFFFFSFRIYFLIFR